MKLSDLLYFLDMTEEQWNKNKTRYGYKEGEDYAKFFERVHGFTHTYQKEKANESNKRLIPEVDYMKAEINHIWVWLKNLEKSKNSQTKEIENLKSQYKNLNEKSLKKLHEPDISTKRPIEPDISTKTPIEPRYICSNRICSEESLKKLRKIKDTKFY